MTFINYASREINCKIVYYGPGLCGKTTNLQCIYDKTNPDAKGKLISLATETDRTLFFDFLPLELGTMRGFKTRFHLYTVPGQVFYDASRKLILKGVDGVVFVADSQVERMDANVEAIENLEINLKAQGYDLRQHPVRAPAQQARPAERRPGRRDGEAACAGRASRSSRPSPPKGIGVFETLKGVAKLGAAGADEDRLAGGSGGAQTPRMPVQRSASPVVAVRLPLLFDFRP